MIYDPSACTTAWHTLPPIHDHQGGSTVRKCSGHHKNMKNLVAMSRNIKRPRLPPLRHPAHIKPGSHCVQKPHHKLIPEGHKNLRVVPVENHGVGSRDYPREAHDEEEGGPEGAKVGSGESRGKEGNYDEDAHEGNGGEVKESRVGVAREGVVDWGEKGADYHEGDAGVVKAPEEEVEAFGVASEEVGEGAAD